MSKPPSTREAARPRNRSWPFAVTLACVGAFSALAPHWIAFAQRPEFEVASVKVNASNEFPTALPKLSGTLVTMHNTRPYSMIFYAYHLTGSYQIAGYYDLPEKLAYGWFDLDARAPEGATEDQVRLMMQSLLEDRFRLKIHRETREIPAYELTLGKSKPRLTPSAPPDDAAPMTVTIEDRKLPVKAGTCSATLWQDGTHLVCHAVSTAVLAKEFGLELQAPSTDRTGLSGTYDVHLRYLNEQQRQRNPGADGPDGLELAVQEELGLKLAKGKGPVEVMVVDHMELPSAN
ncbi:MAG TPA: TIGR03435 family protein [Bryobacteraceae bacterium]|nr:TIGR03435 family protein [Bryobacteraceae bacterium]